MNTVDKPVAGLMKRKRKNAQVININTTGPADIQRIIREY